MADLHAVLAARIDELERQAQGVLALFGHPIWPAQQHEVKRAEHDLRGLAEDRDILRRHGPGPWPSVEDGYDAPTCVGCGRDDFGDPRYLVPCPEWQSLARRHGIEVPDHG